MLVDYVVPPDVAVALEHRGSGCTVLAGGARCGCVRPWVRVPARRAPPRGHRRLRGMGEPVTDEEFDEGFEPAG
jgi:hypothetical protein